MDTPDSVIYGMDSYVIIDGVKTILGSSEKEVDLTHDLDTQPNIRKAVDEIENAVVAVRDETTTIGGQKLLDMVSEKAMENEPKKRYRKGAQSVAVDTVIGRLEINIPNSTVQKLNLGTRAILYSTAFMLCILYGVISQSYRTLADNLNRCFNRDGGSRIKYRTLDTLVTNFGSGVIDDMTAQAYLVLASNGFDAKAPTTPEEKHQYATPTTAIPKEFYYRTKKPTKEDIKQLHDSKVAYNCGIVSKTIQNLEKKYENWKTDPEEEKKYKAEFLEKISPLIIRDATDKELDWTTLIELPYEKVTKITIDGVLTLQQNQKRRKKNGGNGEKDGKFLENHVAVVEADGIKRTLVAPDLAQLFNIVLAYLIVNGLLTNHRLVFFADGAKEIRNAIDQVFSFRDDRLLFLDWYHLTAKIYKQISSGIKGKKSEKRSMRAALKALLWGGYIDEALAYLDQIDSGKIKDQKELDVLKGYLKKNRPYIPSYAFRKALGYRNSSNRVEQANYALVARRQKNSVMSWSRHGSTSLAAVTMLVRNGDLETYLETGHVPLKVYPAKDSEEAA